jgi:hypothetical protein
VLGKQNWDVVRSDLEAQGGLVVTGIPLFIDDGETKETVDLYDKPAEILVVQQAKTMEVRQLVFPSYHGEWLFFRDITKLEGARLMDFVWNACAAAIGISTVNVGYFSWKVSSGKHGKSGFTLLNKLVMLVSRERKGHTTDEARLRKDCAKWLSANSHLLDVTKGSLARQILCVLSDKGRATQAALGHPGLVKGRATNASLGHPELAKGRATHAALGYPGLVKGNATQAALGHPPCQMEGC